MYDLILQIFMNPYEINFKELKESANKYNLVEYFLSETQTTCD